MLEDLRDAVRSVLRSPFFAVSAILCLAVAVGGRVHNIVGVLPAGLHFSLKPQLYGMGLHRLMGTVKYPSQAAPRRSSLSRAPENGPHGLKGGYPETGQPSR
jgi:hypothetical protein